jgi:hypothetical protein
MITGDGTIVRVKTRLIIPNIEIHLDEAEPYFIPDTPYNKKQPSLRNTYQYEEYRKTVSRRWQLLQLLMQDSADSVRIWLREQKYIRALAIPGLG